MKIQAIGLALSLTIFLSGAPTFNPGYVGGAVVVTAQGQAQAQRSAREALIARAKSFELNTPYVAPPGNPLEHEAAGFAKVMCSAIFITGQRFS